MWCILYVSVNDYTILQAFPFDTQCSVYLYNGFNHQTLFIGSLPFRCKASKIILPYLTIIHYFFIFLIDAFRRLCTSPQPYERDECAYFGNLCKNGRCVDTQYSYRCDCYQGYKIDELGTECIGKHFSFDES